MIGWRKIFSIFSAISFILLAFYFFKASSYRQREYQQIVNNNNCTEDNPCVRFCESNRKSDDELFALFMASNYSNFNYYGYKLKPGTKTEIQNIFGEGTKYKILYGEPKCISHEIRENYREYLYYDVSF